jgi:hypothetical protein
MRSARDPARAMERRLLFANSGRMKGRPRQPGHIAEHNMNIGAMEGTCAFFSRRVCGSIVRRIGAGRLSDVHVERAALADGA